MKNKYTIHELEDQALEIRKVMIEMGYSCGTSAHFGGGLSMVELLTFLYGNVLKYDIKNPKWEKRIDLFLVKVMEFSALCNFICIWFYRKRRVRFFSAR